MNKRSMVMALTIFGVLHFSNAGTPLVMQRYRGTQTDDPKIWEGTHEAIKANPGVADDVWFSTGIGYPPLDWHRRHSEFLGKAAAKLRTIGVVPSLQLQATLGHGDSISASSDCSSKTWGGFTGADGTEAKYCSCPRQPGIIDYFVEVCRIYAAWKPHTIWVDDDLRMHNHNPVKEGCWCKTCVDAFSRREGKAWTRETLVKACAADSALNERWHEFGEHSLVEFAEKVIAAVHAVSPETRFGLQCGYDGAHNRALLKAMSDGTGHPAAIRIGGGAYSDRDPFSVVRKAFSIGGALNLIKDYDFMGAICPEVENCPRSYGCKTARGTCVESLLALTMGYNSISIFATDADLETPEWYSTHVYPEIAAAHPVFEAYAKSAEDAAPAGFFYPGFYFDKYNTSKLVGPDSSLVSIGLPIVPAPGKYYGLILDSRVIAVRTDAELKRLIGSAKAIILDGKAAEALVKRGFSAELGGLASRPSGVKRPGFSEQEGFRNETFTDDPLNRGCGVRHSTDRWSGYLVDFADVAEKRVLGEYRRRDKSLGGFGTVLATLKDGRKIAVLGYSGFVDKFVSSGRLIQLQHIADWAADGKLPFVLEDGALACTGVRVRDDGSFAAATVLNTTIGRQAPLKIRIRGLKSGVDRLMFRAFDRTPEALPVVRDGADAVVVIPAIDAWNCAVITAISAGAAGRVQLFNGKDLTGWTAVTDYNVTGGYKASEPTWAVVDGCIRSTGTPFGYLRTERKDYADFKLHVEYRWWRPTEKPNSGVFVRLAADTGSFLPSCVENQLCAGKAGDLLGIWGTSFDGLEPNRKNPFLINVKNKLAPSSEKPAGEWNTIEITVRGKTIENWVNGVKQNSAKKLTSKCGAIALQSEGGAIEFRNVWIEEDGTGSEPVTVKADFTRATGVVKPMHGVGQPPQYGWDMGMFHYLKEAGIPFSRLHDVGGHHGKDAYVDIPNIFRNFDADENDPKSYDFTFTDELLAALVRNGVEPFYRLGITIENRVDIRAYRIYPPKDYAKWARVCEHVIRHYTEGWANGFKWKIRYWEIWNEPDNDIEIADGTYWKGPGTPYKSFNAMWGGTWQQYMELYEVTSKHLKKCFPQLKIGGYGSCGFYAAANSTTVAAAHSSPRTEYFVDCYLKFLKFVKDRNCPLDFFSFHTYSDVKEALRQIDWGIATLHEHGFTKTETTLNEWLPRVSAENLGTASQASAVCAEMIGMQHSKLDSAMIYDARCGIGNYSPLFDPATRQPRKAYYALKAFNEAYKLKTGVEVSSSDSDVYALAAGASDGGVVLVANPSNRRIPFKFDFGGLKAKTCVLTDETHTYAEVPVPDILPRESFVLMRVAAAGNQN